MIYDDEAAGGPPSSQWGPWIPGYYPASQAPPPAWTPGHPGLNPGGLWLPPSAQDPEPVKGSPRWHLYRLLRLLDAQWAGMCLFNDYFEGRHRLAYTTPKFREAFGRLFNGFADNWCPIVVQSSVERMTIEGFRFGTGGQGADDDAWDIWQANNLDAESRKLHTEAIKLGKAAIMVDEGEDARYPRITVEHPSEVYIELDPSDRRRRLSAVKRWVDDEGHWVATIWLPDFVYRFRTAQPVTSAGEIRWVERPGVAFEQHAIVKGVVPLIPADNDPSMLAGGQSDLKVGIPIQDAINKECNDMLVASEYAAYRQRVMTGVEQPKDADGNVIPIELGVSRLFTVEAADARVYDLPASDLKNYIQAVEMYVQHLAAQTHTPPHYLLGHMTNISGDALAAAETGLVAKVRSKLTDFSEPWEEAMRLAFRIREGDDDPRANATDAQTLWRDPESRSFAQTVDGVVKLKEIGVPQEVLWERAGFSPQERARMRTMQSMQELQAMLNPSPTPAAPAAPQAPAPNGRV